MLFLRKSIWPLCEVIGNLQRGEHKLVRRETGVFLRDVYDHTIQVIDTIETYRDMLSGLLDLYLSTVSNKMNAVMKVLTTIATIFIPLTFIAGIYGMNFEFMPELHWRWGYPVGLAFMLLIGIVMLIFFRRKKWLLRRLTDTTVLCLSLSPRPASAQPALQTCRVVWPDHRH